MFWSFTCDLWICWQCFYVFDLHFYLLHWNLHHFFPNAPREKRFPVILLQNILITHRSSRGNVTCRMCCYSTALQLYVSEVQQNYVSAERNFIYSFTSWSIRAPDGDNHVKQPCAIPCTPVVIYSHVNVQPPSLNRMCFCVKTQ